MISYLRARADLAMLDEAEALLQETAGAIERQDRVGVVSARDKFLARANKIERVLGSANWFNWKPPGRPLDYSVPRPLVTTFLHELGDDPYDNWTRQLGALVDDVLRRVRPDAQQRQRDALLLALFPPYWVLGFAGLIVEAAKH